MTATVKKRGLGRGLDALLAGAPVSPGEAVREIALADLHPSRRQPRTRFDEASLAELAESIRVQGVIQPLVVARDVQGGFVIIAGERRWRAARRAGLEAVPAVVREVRDERHILELALVENLQRSDLNPLEEAEAYAALQRDFSLSQDEIAARVGKGRTTVTNALRLLRLAAPVQDLLRAGRLTAGQARPLLSLDDEEEQAALAARAVEESLSARHMEQLAAERQGGGPAAPPREGPGSRRRKRPAGAPEPHAAEAAERLTQRLQTKVEIRRRRRGGEIRIQFHSEEELMRLFDLLWERGGRQTP